MTARAPDRIDPAHHAHGPIPTRHENAHHRHEFPLPSKSSSIFTFPIFANRSLFQSEINFTMTETTTIRPF
jgi:hypothetical protein